MRIITLIREKHLNLELIKVKGHSGIALNERVDQLAKEGAETGYNISTFFTFNSNHVRYFPHFQNIPIEHKFRRFIHTAFQIKAEAEWALLSRIEERLENHSFWWKSSWAFFTNITGFCCNRSVKHRLWSYGVKAFHRLLPLWSLLTQRRPDLYKTLGCVSCGSEVITETWDHFINCPGLAQARSSLYSQISRTFWNLLSEFLTKKKHDMTPWILRQKVNNVLSSILGSADTSSDFSIFFKWAAEVKITEADVLMI